MSENDIASREKGYEQSDAGARGLMWAGIGFALLIAVSFVLVFGIFGFFQERRESTAPAPSPLFDGSRVLPPAPRLQVTPDADLQNYFSDQDSLTKTFGWIKKEAGVARIPVDVAIELSIKKGFPVRKKAGK